MHYALIWMGPVTPMPGDWCAGRILAQHDHGEWQDEWEFSVPLMHAAHWEMLREFLEHLEQPITHAEQLFLSFQQWLGEPIHWNRS